MVIAIPYGRYSSPEQEDGDSVRRQEERAAAWSRRTGVPLDLKRRMFDRGKSAYYGRHRKSGALGSFLAEVEHGDIPAGTILLLENLDRLSREKPWVAVGLLCQIVTAGVVVVVLSAKGEQRYDLATDIGGLITATVELARAHSESSSKSDRMGEVWGVKKAAARAGGTVITRRLPGWVREEGGKLVLVPDRAAVVRRIFDHAVHGMGAGLIARRLTEDKVACWGRSGRWSKVYVHKILAERAAVGEHQPRARGKPDGAPIPGYYPPVVDQDAWQAAQGARASRKGRGGRQGEKVAALFSGLAVDARTGERLLVATMTHSSGGARSRRRRLVPAAALNGTMPGVGFPNDVFEPAILLALKEITPAEVVGAEAAGEANALAVELDNVNRRITHIKARLTGRDDVPDDLVDVLFDLGQQAKDLARRLAGARAKEANPQLEAWAQAQSLLDVATDEPRRLRLRALLKAIVADMRVVIVPRGGTRLAAVQIWFAGGGVRDYLIVYRAAGNGRSGGWHTRSLPLGPADAVAGVLDLRDQGQAGQLEAVLRSIDLDTLRPK